MDLGEWARMIGEGLRFIAIPVAIAIFSAIAGFAFGRARDFREAKQKAYVELLPPILKFAYDRKPGEEEAFSTALTRLWLYGSKRAARSMDQAIGIMHDPKMDQMTTRALQLAVAHMRRDIQLWCWQRLKPEEVKHLYTMIRGGSGTPGEGLPKQTAQQPVER